LAVIIPWAQSKLSHVEKYCSIYTKNGFDVLVVENRVPNIIQPKKSQNLAANLVKFLENNESYDKILIHGFSAAGYVWGETLVQLHSKQNRDLIFKRIKGQVWDSVAGLNQIPIGISNSIFRNNKLMEILLRKSIELMLKIFYESKTKYYNRAATYYYKKAIPAPALIFASKVDPIGTEEHAKEIVKNFQAQNIETTLKVFPDSPHVQHFQKYRENFLKTLFDHLKKCNLLK
jgi:hypothetical protein